MEETKEETSPIPEPFQKTVSAEEAGIRLDAFLAGNVPDASRTMIQDWIIDGRVKVNGELCRKGKYKLKENDLLLCYIPPAEEIFPLMAESFTLPVLYEDADILVIDKPAGMVVHPAPGHTEGTLVNALLAHVPELGDVMDEEQDMRLVSRPGIVHRLDKDTSGCLVVAKNSVTRYKLSEAFAARTVKKRYIALSFNAPPEDSARIETQMGRHPANRQKMAVLAYNGRTAITEYRVLAKGTLEGQSVSLIEVGLHTGRTHQIRVHLSYLKAPIVGDKLYCPRKQQQPAERQMLHARELSFAHPSNGKPLHFVSKLPADFREMIARTEWFTPPPEEL